MDSAERTAHHCANALAVFCGKVQPGISQRLLRARDCKRVEAVEPPRLLRVEEIERVEVIDLRRIVAAPDGWIETRDRGDSRALAPDAIPQSLASKADWRRVVLI